MLVAALAPWAVMLTTPSSTGNMMASYPNRENMMAEHNSGAMVGGRRYVDRSDRMIYDVCVLD